MSDRELTFAIPFHSGRELLEQAIRSVLAQSRPAWRLIVCDDQGTEAGIEELCRSFGDSRIAYHRNGSPLGMPANWNCCLDLAETQLVTLLHADDELAPSYAERMLAAAAEYPRAAALYCRARVIDRRGRPRFSLPEFVKALLRPRGRVPYVLAGEESLAALLRGNFIMCPTLCYRKDRLGTRRFATHWHAVQDLEFTTRLLMEGESIVGLPETLYAYRRHGENASARYTRNLLRFREEFQLYRELETRLRERNWPRAARVARRAAMIKLHLAYRGLRELITLRGRSAWHTWALIKQPHCTSRSCSTP